MNYDPKSLYFLKRTVAHLNQVLNQANQMAELDVLNNNTLDGVYPPSQFTFPLHRAALSGDVDLIKSMIDRGYDINERSFDRVTPLHEACFSGSLECAKLLISNKAEIDAQNIDGSTPLCEAAAKGNVDCVLLLLDHGAMVNPKLVLTSPLHEAAIRGHAEVTEILLKRGARVDAFDCHFGTPLHAACYKNSVGCAKLLIKYGANVNAIKVHTTPLHVACKIDSLPLVQLLVENGANVHAMDNSGRLPIELAPSGGVVASYLKNEVDVLKLTSWCRIHISRFQLGPNRDEIVSKLDLPKILIKFINFEFDR